MSKQMHSLALIDLTADTPCCPPLAERRVPADTAAVLALAFKALGDPVRLQLLSMIASAEGGEACVCDLTPAFDLTGPTISHHLKALREAGLVDAERRGTWVYYRARLAILRQLAALLTVEPTHAG
ncbi:MULTISPECIES: metalloregulator ArsR/SmtB family transcription factor [Micromonospora]|uniref:Transcriptional regulator n=1 Tax=Micromonospora solifontis TaxID=2487138 RepID=A0ABX9WCE4_9ACTN|nr:MULTISPECIES: metalloregulator ArsR/SmtB family transcription factor [Micromonospora]NES17133.1 helix-turn-helix transcriptional regulator [Micromonospora sp. PPF5-17B]NES38989.1 helix-turn-helix transcriptional regulator [Micromonospora solifontis]NES58890.1 helix-turn-helix transcriptional regulator [Micromonospora sp. PPF5-6]RNL92001.1 transcriptional regulator [Micromonospora solifontis]